jgi:hypothetical protein
MTVMVKPKKAEGIILVINPTSVVISDNLTLKDKTIYLPQEKRTYFNSQKYKEGDNVRLMYDRDGNYIDSERLPKRDLTKSELERIDHVVGSGGGESNTALEPEQTELYIQQETEKGPLVREEQPPSGAVNQRKIDYMHIQKNNVPASSQQQHWMTEREKNDTIVIQSLLARSVEIIDGMYRDYPEFLSKTIIHEKGDFEEILITRCNNIEFITDRLLAYVKKKVNPDEPKK